MGKKERKKDIDTVTERKRDSHTLGPYNGTVTLIIPVPINRIHTGVKKRAAAFWTLTNDASPF